MATKTISLKVEAWERLKAARRRPDESFSEVILRAEWPGGPITAGELLARSREHGSYFTDDELDSIEAVIAEDRPPEDKWNER